jgi:hypothetical protein
VESKRQFPRFAHEATVSLTGAGITATGRTFNVSKGGLCAMVAQRLPVGTKVDVELALVFADATHSESIQLPARVVWATALEDRFQVGLAFAPLRPDQLKHLELFLRFLEEGASQRRATTETNGSPFDA